MTAKDILGKALSENRSNLSLYESLRLVESYGIPVAEYGLARTADEAVELAERIGYPVVLKVSSPDVSHKTEIGGVIVGLKSRSDVRDSFRKISDSLSKHSPQAKLEGVVVQKMIEGGYEVIVGGLVDPQFGPVVVVGLGGIFVEVYKDVAFELAPVSPEEALKALGTLKAIKILKGYRGKPPADLESLAEVVSKASNLLWEYKDFIGEMDLNPTFALPRGAVVADARIILRRE